MNNLSLSLQFMSDKYDELKAFKENAAKELTSVSQSLFSIEQKLMEFDEAIESMLKYSYKYNVKLIGIVQENRVESSEESAEICLKLFKALGAKVEERDIDIAHRVKARNTKFPPPIVCKFSRRLARESVMANKKNLGSLDLESINISSTGKILILDHLTPRAQELYHKAKVFKKENDYAFCWTKNGDVLLKQFEDSKIIKVTDSS
ncbi:hypothetical protein AC249_AIPGENE23731 [Exaiptasia diaphana]|nr:hypothetical protein AC249_AIPGENE23731 [Exaiptasia diaphana]